MSRDELLHAYQNGRISRRAFVRALVALGVSIGTANHLADRALADNSHAHPDDVYGGGDGDGIGAGDKDGPDVVEVVDSHPDDPPVPVAVKQDAAPAVTKATTTRTESTEEVTVLPSTGSGKRADRDGQKVGMTLLGIAGTCAALAAAGFRRLRHAQPETEE